MTKKIFRSILLAAVSVLLASLVIIMGCLYDYYRNVQEKQLRDELRLASYGVEADGLDYLEQLASPYRFPSTADFRLTWIAADGEVLFDTHVPAAEMENHADRAEVREAMAEGESGGVRYSETLTERGFRGNSADHGNFWDMRRRLIRDSCVDGLYIHGGC